MNRKTNIAVVDDDREILEIVEYEFLNDADYKFRLYSDGHKFLEDLAEDIDLVILDIHIPDFNVIDAVVKIKEVAKAAYIIIISANRDFDTAVELNNMDIFRFCKKDGTDFLTNLREYIREAHEKILIRKGLPLWN